VLLQLVALTDAQLTSKASKPAVAGAVTVTVGAAGGGGELSPPLLLPPQPVSNARVPKGIANNVYFTVVSLTEFI
jgi:hypothetical protein